MKSVRFFDRRAGYSLASLGLLLGMVVPAAFPAFASAGQIDSRSITMSSSAAGATGVSYELLFTPETAITVGGGLYVDFCDDSPIIGASCGTSTNDVDSTSATLGAVNYNGSAASSAGTITASAHSIKWVAGAAASASQTIDITFNGITNPAANGTVYARVETYDTAAHLAGHTAPDTLGTVADQGAVALGITNAIGVTAYVRESMTFCVSGTAPSGNCGTLNDPGNSNQPDIVTSPSMTLGVDTGNGVKALNSSTLSTGNVFAQLSTNAANGASVNLQSDATSCGGLYLNGDTTKCNIAPNTDHTTNFAAGTAKFGLEVGTASTAAGASDATGTLQATNNYGGTVYFIDYVAGNTSGVTGPYGSAVINSNSAPVSNKNIQLTFGTSINNNTPAGKYGATLRLIAVGTF